MDIMDCQKLITLFNQVGGILVCDYSKNEIIVKNTNLRCDIKPMDYDLIQYTASIYALSPYELNHIVNNNMDHDEIAKLAIKSKNRYLNSNEIGFEIKFLDN